MTRVDELRPGDQMWSPVGRWETITDVAGLGSGLQHIHTMSTKDGYAWTLPGAREVQAMTGADLRHIRTVSVEEGGGGDIIAVLSDPAYAAWHWDDGSVILAQATHKRGEGWTVADRPGDGTGVVATTYDSKAAARSAIIRAARAHARGLGVKYRGRVGAA